MPWWLTITLLALAAVLWTLGSDNRDDVIGLLEQIIATGLLLVVLFVGHQLPVELLALLLALRLPGARRRSGGSGPPPPRPSRREVLIPF
jgi:hypothetical protein